VRTVALFCTGHPVTLMIPAENGTPSSSSWVTGAELARFLARTSPSTGGTAPGNRVHQRLRVDFGLTEFLVRATDQSDIPGVEGLASPERAIPPSLGLGHPLRWDTPLPRRPRRIIQVQGKQKPSHDHLPQLRRLDDLHEPRPAQHPPDDLFQHIDPERKCNRSVLVPSDFLSVVPGRLRHQEPPSRARTAPRPRRKHPPDRPPMHCRSRRGGRMHGRRLGRDEQAYPPSIA
jgi:hypothetical protein